ncbi:phytanoyl-CoA dioxygenase family protein [Acuticoccus mangrovi]|uniref:Phytanoyl-CoA dioxygenase family protein n=1 Tax=Acuticoccus mangrovi TaxID=2796142 RepID=A0A934IJE9_9HYPH|nr:phytanoyl-CoA dioxygenase family protein [Acuticoccus mangrovi]MBJ3777588.1 phytanoyl-CoA dioxygenase family protein [Acuticoccus mangrovi]
MSNWLTAPLWPIDVVLPTKAFSNPLLASERLNRRGLYAARVAAAHALAARRRRRLADRVSPEARQEYAAKGYIRTTPLDAAALDALREEVTGITAPAYEMREGDAVTRRIAITPRLLAAAPRLAALVRSPAYQGPIRYVGSFDVAPQLYIQTIFTHVADGGVPDPQNDLHMDTFHPTVKAWLWFDDVEEATGPFAYVEGSHRLDRRRLAWHKRRSVIASTGGPKGGSFRVSEAERERLRLPEPTRFTVPAGTMVTGDTFGLHRRTRATKPSRRLELWATSRPNPFNPLLKNPIWPPPGMAEREAILWQRFAVWAHTNGLRKRHDWYAVGDVRPLDDPRHPSLG